MAMDFGGCCCSWSKVNPKNSGRYPCHDASVRVESARLNTASSANATSLAGFAVPRIGFMVPLAALTQALALGGWISKFQSLVAGVLCPDMMRLLSCWMVTVDAVNWTSQPASQSCPMESRGWVASCGTMWPWRAASGSSGQFRSASWVE